MAVGWTIGALSGRRVRVRGELRSGRAWSTMKVPVIVASITSGKADWHAIEAAITRSDNDAARRLWDALDDGPGEVEAALRRAGRRRDDARARGRPARLELVRPHDLVARGGAPSTGRSHAASSSTRRHRADPRRHGARRARSSAGASAPCPASLQGRLGAERGAGGAYEVIQVGILGDAVIALAATAPDFEAAKKLASKHVPQHPNAPQLRAAGD